MFDQRGDQAAQIDDNTGISVKTNLPQRAKVDRHPHAALSPPLGAMDCSNSAVSAAASTATMPTV